MSNQEAIKEDQAGSNPNDGSETAANEAPRASGAPPSEDSEEGNNRRSRRAAAARARKQRVQERREAEAVGLDAQEILDDAFVRTKASASKWLKKNAQVLQWLLVLGVVSWAGWGAYGIWAAKVRADASDAVADAVAAERGRIGDPKEQGKPNEQNVVDPSPIFKDDEARLNAARAAFEKAATKREGSGTAMYARLALGSVLLDQGKFAEAKATFEALRTSPLAATDPELRGRALDGLGLALEAEGDVEGALKKYKELENNGAKGFVELALYQQARLLRDLNRRDEAREPLKKLAERLGTGGVSAMPGYLEQGAITLAEELDPELAQQLSQPATTELTPERLQQLQEELRKRFSETGELPQIPAPPEQPAAPEQPVAPEEPAAQEQP